MARPFSRALGVGWMGVGRWRVAWVVAGRKVVRRSWVVGRDGPVDPVDRVIRVWPAHCAAARHSSLVTRHSSVVGCRLSVVVHRCSSSLVQRRPDRLDRTNCSVRCATRLALFHIFCWQACGQAEHWAFNPLIRRPFPERVKQAATHANRAVGRRTIFRCHALSPACRATSTSAHPVSRIRHPVSGIRRRYIGHRARMAFSTTFVGKLVDILSIRRPTR